MFNKQNFCHVASNNRNEKKAGIFVYKTTDNLATVSTSGYFNEKIIDLNLHDLIIHEQTNNADRTKVTYNYLAVTERTLDNVGTTVIKRDLDITLEQAIADLRTYIDNNFVKIDGTSIMTGPLKMRSSVSFKCAIAPSWDGVGFYKLNDNDSLTLMASMETTDGLCPATNNTYNIGKASHKWKDAHIARVITAVINNGYDIAVPVTNSADTLALKSQVDDAANSGSQLYTTGVWYAKMYAATVVPTGAEYDGRNYADFSQVDGNNDPIIVVYTYTSGAWTQTAVINPPKNHNGYMTITSKIWDIAEQAGQQGGLVLWSHNQETFTPYPRIVSFDSANITNSTLTNCTANMPVNPTGDSIVNVDYLATHNGTGRNVGDIFFTSRTDNELNGAVACNGGTYDGADFTGSQNPIALMDAGKLPYVSLAQYATLLSTQGSVGVFGWDGAGTTTFRVPSLNDVFIETGTAAEVGDYISAGMPSASVTNIIGVKNNVVASGGFSVTDTGGAAYTGGGSADTNVDKYTVELDQGVYGNSNTVQPETIRYRAMIQLAISATDEAVMTCTNVTAQVATNTSDIADLQANAAHLAMPSDSYENITVLSSGSQYTALDDGYISVHATATGGANTYIELVSDTSPEFGCSQQAAFNGVMRLFMPVSKNSTYKFWYNGSPTINHFRFYYANGTKPTI